MVLHLDFLYVVPGVYLLIIKDDFSQKVDFIVTDSPTAIVSARALMWWRGRYGLRMDTIIVTDRGSHFANTLIAELASSLKFEHHLVVAYSPWANGRIERINRDVLKFLRHLKSEFRLSHLDIELIIPQVLYLINNAHSDLLNGHTPNEIFFGPIPHTSPLEHIVYPTPGGFLQYRLKPGDYERYFQGLASQLEQLHAPISDLKAQIRAEHRRTHDRKGASHAQYRPGDFVLISVVKTWLHTKVDMTWIGPYQIIAVVSQWVYKVLPVTLVSVPDPDKAIEVHAARLRFYEDAKLNVTDSIKEQFLHDVNHYEVEAILDIRRNDANFELQLLIRWRGFPPEFDTWESAESISKDVPKLVQQFKHKHRANDLVNLL
jgi:hypothetical protein